MTFKSYQKIINLVYLICIAICLFTPRDSQASCSMHDHLCTYHSLGAPVNVQVHGGSAIDNTSNQFVMYAVGTTPTTGTASLVDFDLKGLLPTYTGSRTNELAETYSTPTTPVLISSTTYGRNNPPPDWNKPGDGALQVYPSQYNVYFNQLSAKASHTGDLNGGERIPNPVGCPHMPQGSKNCEAIVVSGNVPNGIYESRARIFNYGNIPNPKVDVALGAYTTGNLMMVTRGHNQVPNGYIEEMSNYSLEGTGAMTPVHQYEVYNRGFKPHAYGVAYYDLNRYTTTYDNVQNYDNYTLQRRYSTKHTTHNRLHGNSGDLDKAYSLSKTELKPLIVAKPPPPLPEKIYCTNGNQSVFCDVPGAVDYNSPEARVLEAKKQEESLILEPKPITVYTLTYEEDDWSIAGALFGHLQIPTQTKTIVYNKDEAKRLQEIANKKEEEANNFNQGAMNFATKSNNRVLGGVQAAGGVIATIGGGSAMVAGAGSCAITALAGCIAAVGGSTAFTYGVDNAIAGSISLWTGEPSKTIGGTVIANTFEISSNNGELAYGVLGLGPAVFKGVVKLPGIIRGVSGLGTKAASAIDNIPVVDYAASAKQSADVVKNADGITEIKILATPLEGQRRLNTLDIAGNGKSNPAEAATAAQLENYLGKMTRYTPPNGVNPANGTPDFVITEGVNAEKTVDAMYTTKQLSSKEIEGLNKFYDKNMASGKEIETIKNHLNKADFVPVDFRVLTPANQTIFNNYVKTLTPTQQAKIIILR